MTAPPWSPPEPTDTAAVQRIEAYLADQRRRLYAAWWRRMEGQIVQEVRVQGGVVRHWNTNESDRNQGLTAKPK